MRFRAFSRQQRRVLTWWCSAEGQSREAVICDGAVRSGKTLCMGLAFFLWATACFDGMAFGLCGKTITALRRNLLREVLPTLGALGFQWREQASQNRLTVRLGGKENTFYLFGGRDEGSAALIQGITLAGVLLDEAALMPRSFVEQACARCSVPGSRMWFSCNPEHPEHWFYKEWILKAEERRALYLHFTMEDNPALTPQVRERYARSFSGAFYRRFFGLDRPPETLAEWRSLPETGLAAATNGAVFEDQNGTFTAFRRALLAYYPEDLRRKKLAARCALAAQSGQYNYARCRRRGDRVAALLALAQFIDHAQAAVFLLNRRYRPYYKWAQRALEDLPLLGRTVGPLLRGLAGEQEDKTGDIEAVSALLIGELARQGLSGGRADFLLPHAREIQAGIRDPDLRDLHLMAE